MLTLAGALALAGCSSRSPLTFEQEIRDDLERDHIPGPDQPSSAGAASQSAASQALPAAGPITLADLLAAAQAHNPALAAARSEVGIAAGGVWQASLYPNPQLEISSEEAPFRDGPREGNTMVSLTQPIVIGRRLRAGVDAAQAQRAASLAGVETQVREIFGEIAALHARLLAIRQADALYSELATLGGETLSVARTRFEARAAPETEVIRPQIELYQIDLARSRLSKEQTAAIKQLSFLLGGVEVEASRLSGEITDQPEALDFDALASLLRASHPALIAADRQIDVAAARLEGIKAQRVPDLDIRVGAGYSGEGNEGIFEVGAGMTVPIWDNRQGDILAARFALMQARQQRLATENELLGRLAAAHGEYESARAQIQTVRDRIIPAAARSYEQTQETYRGGRGAFLELLDAQRTLTEARTTLIELSGEAAAARAGIMQIVGQLDATESPGSTVPAARNGSSTPTNRPTPGQR